MIKLFNKRFYKDPDSRWYIDLPEYIEGKHGTKSNLEMVAGADKMLDSLSEGKSDVMLTFSNGVIEDYDVKLERKDRNVFGLKINPDVVKLIGADYSYKRGGESLKVWLCPVTLYVFDGFYPKEIYVKKTTI